MKEYSKLTSQGLRSVFGECIVFAAFLETVWFSAI